MPNFGVWEWVTILILGFMFFGVSILIVSYILPTVIEEIRKMRDD